MKMTYTILWFDDDADWLDSLDLDSVKTTIAEWGFTPEIEFAHDAAAFMSRSPFHSTDLIVVDYNLGNDQQHGEAFIRQVRDHECLTEVIFYSAAGSDTLWDAVRTAKLEGVFVANRQGVSSKIEKVGHQSVRKVIDLNMMRGMVMAEVGELDLLIDDIVEIAFGSLETEQRRKIFAAFHESTRTQHDSRLATLDVFNESPTVETMFELSDSNKRYQNLRRVIKAHPKLKGVVQLGDFVTEVLFPRNCLAHGKPRRDGDCDVFTFAGKEYRYDQVESVRLRKTILKYRESFQVLHARLV